jgi:hypothetical protein
MHGGGRMRSRGHIDRRKHEVDIVEHIAQGGIRAEPSSKDITLDEEWRPWPLGVVSYNVRVEVLDYEGHTTEWPGRPPPEDGRKR